MSCSFRHIRIESRVDIIGLKSKTKFENAKISVVEMSSDDLPFRAEYAKSNRAGCKKCKEKIDKGELRLAVMVQSPMFDGKQGLHSIESIFP